MKIVKYDKPVELIDMFLIADPDNVKVKDYLNKGDVYVLEDDKIIGGYVLVRNNDETVELINLVVKESYHNQGYGKKLVEHAIKKSKTMGAYTLEVGTGNSSFSPLYLYQKCGFKIVDIDKDFFIKHYKKPIYENGIKCRDMIRLSINL